MAIFSLAVSAIATTFAISEVAAPLVGRSWSTYDRADVGEKPKGASE